MGSISCDSSFLPLPLSVSLPPSPSLSLSLPLPLRPSLHPPLSPKEGAALLEGEQLEKTRGQTAASKEVPKSPTTPTRVKRTTTISQTTEVRRTCLPSLCVIRLPHVHTEILACAPLTHTLSLSLQASSHILGSEERGRTRSQTRRMSEREEDEPSRPAVKRASTMAQTAKVCECLLSVKLMCIYTCICTLGSSAQGVISNHLGYILSIHS